MKRVNTGFPVYFLLGALLCLVSACNKSNDTMPGDLQCSITAPSSQGCTAHLTLRSGSVEIDSNGTFEFVGTYQACFDRRTIEADGQYRSQTFPGGMNLELLAKTISGGNKDDTNFARTMGTINLELNSLKGVYTDLWAIMASRGTQSKDRNQRLTVRCQR